VNEGGSDGLGVQKHERDYPGVDAKILLQKNMDLLITKHFSDHQIKDDEIS
jgi:hypothetical protein